MTLAMERDRVAASTTAGLDTWLLLQQTYLLAYKAVEQALTRVGVSHAQASVLLALKRAGEPLPLSRLARVLVQEAQSVTSLVDRLESRGLVRRVPDRRDRRVIHVELTDQGEQAFIDVLPAATRGAEAAFAWLDADASARLRELLTAVRACSAGALAIELSGLSARVEEEPRLPAE